MSAWESNLFSQMPSVQDQSPRSFVYTVEGTSELGAPHHDHNIWELFIMSMNMGSMLEPLDYLAPDMEALHAKGHIVQHDSHHA